MNVSVTKQSTEQDSPGESNIHSESVLTMTANGTLRNVFVISFSYFLFFTGFSSLSNLQSTMNADKGVGPDSQAVIYLCSMASCFLPQLLIEKFGAKKTFLMSVFFSCPYIAANFQLRWDTFMSTSVLYGLVSGPLNAAMTLYLDEMATRYKTSESKENVKAVFFGFNVFFSECTQVVGNSLSYYILDKSKHVHVSQNVSDCGIDFSSENRIQNNTNLIPPSQQQRMTLTGVYLLLAMLAVIFAFFLDPLRNDVKDIRGCRAASRTFFGFVRLLRDPRQLLLIPISIFCGIEGAFYSNEFTEAFIACSWGVHHVGFVSICFGVCGATMAIAIGPLVKCVSQMSVILLAATLNAVTFTLLFVWQPSPDVPVAYFAFAGVWGMTDAIWWSQVAALYGLMFPNDREAAFSNFFFWSFLGYFLSYSYATVFTVAVKISIMFSFLIVGITLYVVGQIKIKRRSRGGDYVAIETNSE